LGRKGVIPTQPTRLRPAGIYLVGLTGGIATGKSLVAAELRRLGAWVVDADAVARRVVAPGSRGLELVIQEFGREYLRPDGTLDRKKLACKVFGDAEARRRLEALLHPLISQQIYTLLAAARDRGTRVAVVEAPVLIEAGLHTEVDELWVVTCSPERQKERLRRRDGLTPEEAELRLAAQLPGTAKTALADQVIDNSGSPEATRRQVQRLWRELLARVTPDEPPPET